jgi:hypothetical protein
MAAIVQQLEPCCNAGSFPDFAFWVAETVSTERQVAPDATAGGAGFSLWGLILGRAKNHRLKPVLQKSMAGRGGPAMFFA